MRSASPSAPLLPCLLFGALLLHGCKTPSAPSPAEQPRAAVVAEQVPAWRRTASGDDQGRVDQLAQAWDEALAEAGKGSKRALTAEGKLLDPGAGLPRPAPAPGSYMCRLIQLGSTSPRVRPFAAAKPVFCYVGVDSDGRLWLAKQTGPFRRQGYLWDDRDPNRMIFLGSLASGAKDPPPTYGVLPDRDQGGVLERIGPLRFRLVTPRPASGHKLEVLELTPAPSQLDQ
ncbi:MAG TPA: DUF4893 domain-containing protein [Allosphingosinicella sp.]|nr:DUF4893 domain-containing protein [Allosphingosinicella sp.]